MLDDRALRTYTTGVVTKTLRILGVALIVGAVIALFANHPRLPMMGPTYFNICGEADAFGSKQARSGRHSSWLSSKRCWPGFSQSRES